MLIDRRFRGPATSGNGGYTCGLVAALVGNAAEVTLRVPPPLDVPLRVEGTSVWAGETLVAEAVPASIEIVAPAPVSFDEATRAAEPDFDTPFPECFVCGHARADGLRIFA